MTHLPLDDWRRLGEAWRGATPDAAEDELYRRVRRQTRRTVAQLAVETLVTMAAGWLLWYALAHDPSAQTRVVCAGLGMFTAGVWAIRIRAVWGVLWPSVPSMTAYRVLERERLVRRVGEARWTGRICIAALSLCALLAVIRWRGGGGLTLGTLIPAAACGYLIGWIVWARHAERRYARELAAWDAWLLGVDDEPAKAADSALE